MILEADESPSVHWTEEQELQEACTENSPKMQGLFMQAAVWIRKYDFHDAGMTVPNERQKFQERKRKNSNGTKLTPPPSKMA